MTLTLARLGFDASRLSFALRTAIAACIAFVAAWALGLEHPQWAGMAVWASSQPLRGQLLEKSFFRFAGTVTGTIVGVLLVVATHLHPAAMVVGLALWVGLCTGIGNLQRGFVAYGTVLAGYTAAMIALLDTGLPDSVLALGADRMATVLTGVVVASLVGYAFAPPADGRVLRKKVRLLLADLLDRATQPASPETLPASRDLLDRIAEIEEQLDPHGAGSFRSRGNVRATRRVLIAAVPIVLRMQEVGSRAPDGAAAASLRAAAEALRDNRSEDAAEALGQALEALTPDLELHDILSVLQASLLVWVAPSEGGDTTGREKSLPVVLHRDWTRAREAMLRATCTLLVVGAVWLATGISVGNFMMLGLSVMISLFSTSPDPAKMMRNVTVAQGLGVLGAIACRWLAWPFAENEFQLILLTLPFILVGPLLMGHRRTTAVSFDYNMVLLLMTHPHWPLTGTFGNSVAAGLAVLAGPLAALVAYRYIFPVTPKRQVAALIGAMLHDLASLAGNSSALADRPVWRARFYHRSIRLMRVFASAGRSGVEALNTSLALLKLDRAVMRSHALVGADDTAPRVRRAARIALARLEHLEEKPAHAAKALLRLASRLPGAQAEPFREAAEKIPLLAAYISDTALPDVKVKPHMPASRQSEARKT